MAILDAVDGVDGFFRGLRLDPDELDTARALIEAQWRTVLADRGAVSKAEVSRLQIDAYHEMAIRVPHPDLWPKRARLLPADAVDSILRMSVFRRLASEIGDFAASDEEGLGRGNIYWRLVRPHQPADIGPLHADQWFWDLGYGTTPSGCRRLKLWVAIVSEPGRNGLRVVPGSHRRKWRYHGEVRDGRLKPRIDEDEDGLGTRLVPTAPGDAIVFHDALLHGGAVNLGECTRVSFELTLFIPCHERSER